MIFSGELSFVSEIVYGVFFCDFLPFSWIYELEIDRKSKKSENFKTLKLWFIYHWDCFLKIFSGMMLICKGNMSVKVKVLPRTCESDSGQNQNFEFLRKITFSHPAYLIMNIDQFIDTIRKIMRQGV